MLYMTSKYVTYNISLETCVLQVSSHIDSLRLIVSLSEPFKSFLELHWTVFLGTWNKSIMRNPMLDVLCDQKTVTVVVCVIVSCPMAIPLIESVDQSEAAFLTEATQHHPPLNLQWTSVSRSFCALVTHYETWLMCYYNTVH